MSKFVKLSTYCKAKSKKSARSSIIHSGREENTLGTLSAGSGRAMSSFCDVTTSRQTSGHAKKPDF